MSPKLEVLSTLESTQVDSVNGFALEHKTGRIRAGATVHQLEQFCVNTERVYKDSARERYRVGGAAEILEVEFKRGRAVGFSLGGVLCRGYSGPPLRARYRGNDPLRR